MNAADLFSNHRDPVLVLAGTALFHAGDPGDTMYVVLEGELQVEVNGQVLEVATRGGIIGEMALIDHSPRGATVVARTDAKLARIDERRFHFMIQEHPFFATLVMKTLADRLRRMNSGLSSSEG